MNRLAEETSPYLLQHADNPVEWLPWGPEALERARSEDRPILLSIGYSACHWCHVMAHESFEDPETAELMNRLFVNIKVDREERPDLDAVYMNAVVSLTGQGGWPMTVFLTPEGKPFYGGTYYPPTPRFNMPSFQQVLVAVADAYRDKRDDVMAAAGRLTEALDGSSRLGAAEGEPDEEVLRAAVRRMGSVFDEQWAGFGNAPKFPPASAIEFLLQAHHRFGDPDALRMAAETLDAMALGGMYDVLGGGFARYSVDRQWLVPHFEKMLYDNALLAAAYLHGWVVTGKRRHRQVAEETLDYLLAEMLLPEGVFASAQDADTDGHEGLTYVWTPDQLRDALPAEDAAAAIAYYGVTDAGNFEGGTTVLRPSGPEPQNLSRIREALLRTRASRPQPARDDKAITAWNAFAVSALAEAGWRLDRADYLDAARSCAGFILERMTVGGDRPRLLRSYRAGEAKVDAFLDDWGGLVNALLDLHAATGEARWLDEAVRFAERAVELFADHEAGGFFYSSREGEQLVARHKDLDDNPTPSGQSLMAMAALRLSRITGQGEELAAGVIRLGLPYIARSAHAFGELLRVIDVYVAPPVEVVIAGDPANPVTGRLAKAARSGFHPTAVYAFTRDGGDLPLLEGKGEVGGRPAVYVCERFACRAPVTDPELVAVP